MRYINLFYLSVLGVGIALFLLLRPTNTDDLSFYGFAESNETEINYNYAVVVDKILVKPGQSVKAGETLLHLFRQKSKDVMDDQSFRIAELRAEENLWRQKKESEIAELLLARNTKMEEIDTEILATRQKIEFNRSLLSDLRSITPDTSTYDPLRLKLETLNKEKSSTDQTFALRIDGLRKEILLGDNPYKAQINRYEAERAFEADHLVQEITVTAPGDGIIGNIECKEQEHIPSYKTLLSFYEPHSGMVKGYVHESLTFKVNIGDRFNVSSLKNEEIVYPGTVMGLGSRIVEIPARLRKIPTIKSYGREVLIEISVENSFLQKEKVSISLGES